MCMIRFGFDDSWGFLFGRGGGGGAGTFEIFIV